jgi:DNA adenine methylase
MVDVAVGIGTETANKVWTCRFCGFSGSLDEFEPDRNGEGFWCVDCDGYTYFNEEDNRKQKFILILEVKADSNDTSLLPKVRLNKRLSPLRYPGGKSKLAHYLYSQMQGQDKKTFVETHAGGASVGLALLDAKAVKKLILNDIDFGIYALFKTIKDNPQPLIDRVMGFRPNHEDFFSARQTILDGYKGCDLLEAAWLLLRVNRLAYSGICKANPLGGKNGSRKMLVQRWKPENLCKRIRRIHEMGDNIEIYNIDACELIEEMYWDENAVLFIDPPYFRKGKQLYVNYYEREDHLELSWLLDTLYQGFPCADIILTYDNDEFIEQLYMHPVVKKISRKFSV